MFSPTPTRARRSPPPSASTRRLWADRLLHRSAFLDAADRALLEQVIGRGASPTELARAANLSPRSVQRRVQRLAQRLSDPEVESVLRQADHWPAQTAAVGLALWVKGWTQRQTAQRLNLSLHRVRCQAMVVRGLLESPIPGPRR